MSPELMRFEPQVETSEAKRDWSPRNERYDFHVDMWALGCICFEFGPRHTDNVLI